MKTYTKPAMELTNLTFASNVAALPDGYTAVTEWDYANGSWSAVS